MLRNVFGGCVSDRSSEAMRHQKVKFGAPLSNVLKHDFIPIPLVELLVYMAREGINTADLFRRPGNPSDTRRIVKRLTEGKPIILSNYSFYTLTSVIKKFLLSLPGGVFGEDGEEKLLHVLTIGHKMEQYDTVHEYIVSLTESHQHLLSLLFGIWFTMVHNSEKNYMSTEALSRSVAGSMFHTCSTDPAKVEKASRIMQLLIDNFGVARVFGQSNIEYFAEVTHIAIHVREMYKYPYVYPAEEILPPISEEAFLELAVTPLNSSREPDHDASVSPEPGSPGPEIKHFLVPGDSANRIATSTVSVPEVSLVPSPEVSKRPKSVEDNLNEVCSSSQPKQGLSRYNSIKRKQLERLRQRSDWFLGPNYSPLIKVQPPDHQTLKAKTSGNSITRASSEGAVLDVLSDGDSVFTDNTSRSESPASEPVRTNSSSVKILRDILHSDTIGDVSMGDIHVHEGHDISDDDDMTESEICYFMIEHKYGDSKS